MHGFAYPSLICYFVHIQGDCMMISFDVISNVCIILAHLHTIHFPNLIRLIVTKYMLSQQISNPASWEDLTVILKVNTKCISPLQNTNTNPFRLSLCQCFLTMTKFFFLIPVVTTTSWHFDMPLQTVPSLSVASSTLQSPFEFQIILICCVNRTQLHALPCVCICFIF